MSLNKAQKLVRMTELLYRRDSVRATELMDLFELDTRTLRRYITDMIALNMPVQDEGIGFERRIWLPSGFRRAGVQLGLSEVLSLHFGRRLFTFLDGTPFAEDLDGAIERLQPASMADAPTPDALDRLFLAVSEHAKEYTDHGELIDEIVTALIYDNPLRATYLKPGGEARELSIEPYTLATYRQGLYLFARDRADGRLKTLAVDRFRSLERLRQEKFSLPDDYQPRDLVRYAFGIIGGEPVPVTLHFEPPAMRLVDERAWHASQQLVREADGSGRLRLYVSLSEELVSWILSFGPDVTVEDPAELSQRVREAHRAALERLTRR